MAVSINVSNKADLDPVTGLIVASQLPPATPQKATGTYLETGGAVAYLATAYNFRVSPATFVIQGTRGTSTLTDVSLSSADATFDRFDSIVVSTNGTVSVVLGTPAANPSTPDVDPLSQLVLSTILVRANTTTPDVTNISIYAENTEWTSSVSGNIVANSTSGPFAGTKCIQATSAAAGAYVRLTNSSLISLTTQKQLVFMLNPTTSFPNQKSIRVTWYSGTVKIGDSATVSNGRYGYANTSLTYQQIVIPLSEFNISSSSTVDRLEFYVNGSGNAISFRIDNVFLEPNSTVIQPTVTTLEGSQITGEYATCGMTMTGPNKVLGRLSNGTGPAQELNFSDVAPATDDLVQDIADFIPSATENRTYSSNGDTNGVFYKIGQLVNNGSWAQPSGVANGVVFVASSTQVGSLNNLTDRTTAEWTSGDQANNWFGVDLGLGRSLIVGKYMLQMANGNQYIRSWKLQGCNNVATNDITGFNNATWTDLDTRVNDTSLNSALGYYVPTVNSGATTAFRWIRILKTGTNAQGTNYMQFAEFELYGTFTYIPSVSDAGTVIFTGTAAGELKTRGTVVSTTTGNQDNLSLANYETLVCNNSSTTTIRGIVAGVFNGERKRIYSIGVGSVVVAHQNSNSTTTNRIITTSGLDITMPAGTGIVDLIYETTNSRWRAVVISGSPVGLKQNSQSADYTLTPADADGHVYHPSADTTGRTWTIPANASVAYPIGTTLTFINDTSAGVITIAITTDTLVLAGTGTTGSRFLAANGVATAVKMTSTRWQINGTGLT